MINFSIVTFNCVRGQRHRDEKKPLFCIFGNNHHTMMMIRCAQEEEMYYSSCDTTGHRSEKERIVTLIRN